MTSLAAPVSSAQLTFSSGGVPIRLTAFTPAGAQKLPAVLVLHGASGLNSTNRYVRQVAEAWAGQGFVTLLLHYFDRTGTDYASDAAIYRDFEAWLATIGDALTCAGAQPAVDPARIGLVGYSLGGYLAVAQAARDSRVRAVVEIAGGIDPETERLAAKLPPVLVIHGEADRRVPFERAQRLQQVLEEAGTPHETRFFPGEGHLLSPAAAFAALDAGAEFLQKHL